MIMKKAKLTTVVLASLFALNSCQKDESSIVDDQEVSVTDEVQEPELEITAEVLETLENNFFNTSDIAVVDSELPDGTTEQGYLVDGDILISAEEVRALPEVAKVNETEKHFRSTYLVSPRTRTITVLGWTEKGFGKELSASERTALRWAVDNYNALGLSIRFDLSFGGGSGNFRSHDIVVIHDVTLSIGDGIAPYPKSNGDPGKLIGVNISTSTLNPNAKEFIMTHEIGHAIGLRHIDWDTKKSCSDLGVTQSSDSSSHGVIPIPGTISGFDHTSIMVACYNKRVTNGEFSWDDKKALRYLYPRSSHTF